MSSALELDHIALPIHHVAASLEFYRDVLGLTLSDALSGDDWGGYPWLMMIFDLADGRQLALCALAGAPDRAMPALDIEHVAFQVETMADLAAWKARLRERKVEITEEDHGAQKSIYFQDPNHLTLEITMRPRGRQADDPAATIARWLER